MATPAAPSGVSPTLIPPPPAVAAGGSAQRSPTGATRPGPVSPAPKRPQKLTPGPSAAALPPRASPAAGTRPDRPSPRHGRSSRAAAPAPSPAERYRYDQKHRDETRRGCAAAHRLASVPEVSP